MASDPIKNGDFELSDTGNRRVFDTGAQRDAGDGRGFFHCFPWVPMERLAKLYEAGAKKYGRDNYLQGMPLSCFIDSTMRHTLKLSEGWTDEDHAAAIMWNAASFMWTADAIERGDLPASLDDIGWLKARGKLVEPVEARKAAWTCSKCDFECFVSAHAQGAHTDGVCRSVFEGHLHEHITAKPGPEPKAKWTCSNCGFQCLSFNPKHNSGFHKHGACKASGHNQDFCKGKCPAH